MEMKKWASKLKRTIKEDGRKGSNLAIISVNNHYAGFGPGTANIFRKMAGLPEAESNKEEENKKWEDDKSHLQSKRSIQKQYHNSKQSTISVYEINSLAITISFIACNSYVKYNDSRWKQGNKLGSNGSSKRYSVDLAAYSN
jgi:hypothetical protein